MSNPTVEPIVTPQTHFWDMSRPLQGRAASVARAFWWLCVGLILVMTVIAIPLTAQSLHEVCAGENCNPQQPSPEEAQSITAAGLSLDALAFYSILFNLLPTSIYLSVALLLFFRKPNDKMAYLTSLALALFGGVTYPSSIQELAISQPIWAIPYVILNYLGSILIAAFFFTFPNGVIIPRWFRWVLVFWVIEEVLDVVSGPPLNLRLVPEELPNFSFILIILSGIFAQVYRYIRVSNDAERQQSKWVLFGVTIALGTLLIFALVFFARALDFTNVFIALIATAMLSLTISLIPISIGIAILRSHLWDIDLIINRTLVYGALTAILAGILAVSSDLSKRFFLAVTGESSELAPIVATLIVVAAFEPLKKRLQEFVDRHFKYATGKFGAFGQELQIFLEMNDPDELARRFLKESLETFGAGSGAVYLGRGTQQRLVTSIGAWDGHAELAVPLEYAGVNVGLIALGARKNGIAYDATDRANLTQTGDLVAHAIQLSPRIMSGEHDASSNT